MYQYIILFIAEQHSLSDGYMHHFMFWAFMNKMIFMYILFMYTLYLLGGRVARIRSQCIFAIIRNWKIMFWSVCACALCSVTQSCLILCDLMGCSHQDPHLWISQARILEWIAIFSSRESFWPRGQNHVSCVPALAGRFFPSEPPGKPKVAVPLSVPQSNVWKFPSLNTLANIWHLESVKC